MSIEPFVDPGAVHNEYVVDPGEYNETLAMVGHTANTTVAPVRDRASTIVGDSAAVDSFVAGREILHRESLGRVASVTVPGALSDVDLGPGARLPRPPAGRIGTGAGAGLPQGDGGFAGHLGLRARDLEGRITYVNPA